MEQCLRSERSGRAFRKHQLRQKKQRWWKPAERWNDYWSWGPGGGQSVCFKYSPSKGLQGKWRQRSLPWSIAECLPGICLFNPLSKAIWACDVDGRTAADRKSRTREAGYMWRIHTHRPTQPCSHVETRALILLMWTLVAAQTTADVNTHPHNRESYRHKFSLDKEKYQGTNVDHRTKMAGSANSWTQEVLHFEV